MSTHYDAVVIGGGHNGMIASAYLGRAGCSVLLLERDTELGGATRSQRVFKDYDAWLSRYSYLVSLLPEQIIRDLELDFATRRREIASFTPYRTASGRDRGLLLSNVDAQRSRESVIALTGHERAWSRYQDFLSLEHELAQLAWPSFLRPMQPKRHFLEQLKTGKAREAWDAFVERPLGEAIERYLDHDILRGLVMTDGKIGVLSHPHDPRLLQNRCFLYHVIGGGTGEWRVPVGGMRALVHALEKRCREANVVLRTRAEARAVSSDGLRAEVVFDDGDRESTVSADFVLINAGPRTRSRLLGLDWQPRDTDEGSVIKMNVLLARLPRLKAEHVNPRDAFCGSFHIDEGYGQMQRSYERACAGEIPNPPPAEIYCHTLTDSSILSQELHARGFQTLTLFGLDMPYRLFVKDHDRNLNRVRTLYLEGLNRLCDEPFENCVARDADGELCIELKSPQDLEREIDLDLGNIFHDTLSWFYADDDRQVGTWGVETEHANILNCGSSAARGGAVSGIPGHNAAQRVLQLRGTTAI